MIYIAIVDDDKDTLDLLGNFVEDYYKNINLQVKIYKYLSSNNVLNYAAKFDIFLLDIDLPQKNGLELAKEIRQVNLESCICFITNYNKFASVSYSVHAFDFIEKPVDKMKIYRLFDEIQTYNAYKMLTKNNLIFKTNHTILSIQVSHILYFEYFDKGFDFLNRSTVLYTDAGKHVLHSKISDVYSNLPQDIFVIPHKSFIINLLNIKCINNNTVIMNNNVEIPLSQKRASTFRKSFNTFIKKYLIGQ